MFAFNPHYLGDKQEDLKFGLVQAKIATPNLKDKIQAECGGSQLAHCSFRPARAKKLVRPHLNQKNLAIVVYTCGPSKSGKSK
jgi:hypothetical protein